MILFLVLVAAVMEDGLYQVKGEAGSSVRRPVREDGGLDQGVIVMAETESSQQVCGTIDRALEVK